ncbi:hypothetical protein PCANC_03691 [Puccinia coronata f. sp. avenae]|uniref:Uncharacterized protein n=1 Tax=Puccinia coronata f. sp. avenae TaxID=200324 RepID=A0A2N5VXR1_9BASI|nr:hypothetical protein PCANC_03691 [Puccinia coronata f. sp. avenae]
MVTSARRLVAPPPPAVRGISSVPQLAWYRPRPPIKGEPLSLFPSSSASAGDLPPLSKNPQKPSQHGRPSRLHSCAVLPGPRTRDRLDGNEAEAVKTSCTEPANDHGLPPATSRDAALPIVPTPVAPGRAACVVMRRNPANPEGWLLKWRSRATSRWPFDRAPVVNLAARTETLHIGPRAASIEYLASRHPDDTDDDGSSDGEPSAPSGLASFATPAPAPSPNYLTLTPSEIDRLLHDTRPFQHRFVYTPNHIRGIADDIFRELSAFLSFYAPASEQEAAARIYLYRAFQSHFNRRL